MDIVGLTLEDARAVLTREGFTETTIKVTAPPREKSRNFDESYRVLRVNSIHGKSIEILVCKPL